MHRNTTVCLRGRYLSFTCEENSGDTGASLWWWCFALVVVLVLHPLQGCCSASPALSVSSDFLLSFST